MDVSSQIEYSLGTNDSFPELFDYLSINASGGQLSLLQPFDREQIASISFKVCYSATEILSQEIYRMIVFPNSFIGETLKALMFLIDLFLKMA